MNEPVVPPGPSQVLAVLCRWPELGRAKSRLAAELGVAAAHRVYRALLHRAVASALEASSLPHRRALFFVSPPGRCESMREWLRNGEVLPQTEGDWGRRLRTAAAEAFRRGAEAVLLMGSDCPLLTPARLEQAFAELVSHRVVLGPAREGGLYLVGLSQPAGDLFRPLRWESPRVAACMRNRCRRLGLEVAELPPLPRIGRVQDLTDEVLRLLHLTRSQVLAEGAL